MKEQLLNNLLNHDLQEAIREMIEPSRSYGATMQSHAYDCDFSQDVIDGKYLSLRVHKFMELTLSLDDFTNKINQIIFDWEEEENKYSYFKEQLFDYEIFDRLVVFFNLEHVNAGYTYNYPDHCDLNRDLHHTIFKHDGDYYVLVMVHYGADARIGFGDCACFKIDDYEKFEYGMELRIEINDDGDELMDDIEEVATYDESIDGWVMKDNGYLISLYTHCDS